MNDEKLRIDRVQIRNIRAIEALDVQPGQTTQVTGKTGAGKTSFFEALQAAFQGQTDRPALVRDGEDVATVIVELSDGTEVQRTYTAASTKTPGATVTREGMVANAPQTYLNQLLSPYSFDPVKFLLLDADDQAEELLKLIDLDVDEEQFVELGGGEKWFDVDYDQSALEVVQDLEKVMYTARRDVGRDQKTAEETAKGLRSEIPQDFDPDDVRETNLRDVTEQLAEVRAENARRAGREEQNAERRRALENLDQKILTAQEKIADLKRQIAELEQDISSHENEQETIAAAIAEDSNWLEENPEQDTSDLEAQIAAFEEQKNLLGQHDRAAEMEEKAGEYQKRYDELTEHVDACRAAPGDWLGEADLPVEGLGYDPDEETLTIHGRPVGALSSGEKVLLAIQIAKATCGELGVMLVDDLGLLDEETREVLLDEAIADEELQWFVGWADRGDELHIIDLRGADTDDTE